ncbi:hypothetical protein [Arcobacter suis]|nr:hypothetical protein [Arcobacter suis]
MLKNVEEGIFMDNVIEILERLFNFYKVTNVAELSQKIETSQATISSWKVRNSINAVKKKCRELNIYDEIFTDKVLINENIFEDELNTIYDILIDNAKYTLKDKINKLFDKNILNKMDTYLTKKILIRVLNKLKEENKRYPINISKKYLLKEISDTKINFTEPFKRKELISIIEKNFSNLECYVLINYYEELLEK